MFEGAARGTGCPSRLGARPNSSSRFCEALLSTADTWATHSSKFAPRYLFPRGRPRDRAGPKTRGQCYRSRPRYNSARRNSSVGVRVIVCIISLDQGCPAHIDHQLTAGVGGEPLQITRLRVPERVGVPWCQHHHVLSPALFAVAVFSPFRPTPLTGFRRAIAISMASVAAPMTPATTTVW